MLTRLLNAARQIRRSDVFKDAVATPARWTISRQQRANEGIFSIEIESVSGFFAVMQTILFILSDQGCRFRLRATEYFGHPGLAIGREALVTCLLLSRCGFLIKTPSYLSGWAKIFNPLLPVWLISPLLSRGLFPDRQLWMDQESGAVKYD
jgi:hypothetical protein